MRNRSITTFLVLSLFLVGCKTIHEKEATWQRKLEPHAMMFGNEEQIIKIDRYVVAAQVPSSLEPDDPLAETLRELDLEWVTPQKDEIAIDPIPGAQYHFALIKKRDGSAFGPNDYAALQVLQEKHAIPAGPAIFYDNGLVWGILPHYLMVYTKRLTPADKIDEIFQKAHRAVQTNPDIYHVEFDRSIGYDILEVGQEFYDLQEVTLVEHPLWVITSFSDR